MDQREERIKAAEVYLYQGLVRQNGPAVREVLAPDCWRLEQGRNTGRSSDEIADAFKLPVFDVITGIGPVRWLVEGDELIAFYELELQNGEIPAVLIAERFLVRDGKIHEIEAIFHAPPRG